MKGLRPSFELCRNIEHKLFIPLCLFVFVPLRLCVFVFLCLIEVYPLRLCGYPLTSVSSPKSATPKTFTINEAILLQASSTMCRLLGYLGSSIQLDRILLKPEHSLVVQSYQPREMTAGLLNADGFGIGWYGEPNNPPYAYKNILPIWNDANLPQLGRYIKSSCYLGYVRSATSNLSVDMINCQPFSHQNLLFVHNGFIDDFRQTLYRPIRNKLDDFAYRRIEGTTDSEHIFALIVNELEGDRHLSLQEALNRVIIKLIELASPDNIDFSANIVLTNGTELAASRYSNREASPTLYYTKEHSLGTGIIIASEPLFEGNWTSIPEKSLIGVGENLEVIINSIS